jgi:hypothetical protein
VGWRQGDTGGRGQQTGGGRGPDDPFQPELALIVLIFALTLIGALVRLFG